MAKNISKKKLKLKQIEITPKLFFAVRIRGAPGMSGKIEDTLTMLRMNRINHGVLVWGQKSSLGMLKKVKDYIAFGEIDQKTLVRLLRVRGRVEGNKSLTDEYIKKYTEYSSIKEFAKGLFEGQIKYNSKDMKKIKPVFRLHPPIKGFRGSIKKSFNEGGTLGYVGNYINVLIHKMI
ncbi:MAG: 50S ribosomal protein L30 [Candidatus Lokiarchaeota archaeon]|nr:50S ribosomal protein L30 [Candidatus Lokiarchaeota archaeon]MBD3200771.1 50S ribosomal protein L30 [Candidatus Lokiarchaeota archaeon]